jgi:hypothetical protein
MQIFLPAFLEQIEKDRGQPTIGPEVLGGASKFFTRTEMLAGYLMFVRPWAYAA